MSTFGHYLCKRFILEKGYALWMATEEQLLTSMAQGEYKFVPPFCLVPEVAPLREHFDFMLIRADGMVFNVVCIRELSATAIRATEEKMDLITGIGQACEKYTGRVGHSKVPVCFQFIYLADNATPEDADLSRAKYRSRAVNASACVVALRARTVWTNRVVVPQFLQMRFLRRWLDEQALSDEQLIAQAASGGIRIIPILIGAAVAIAAALTARRELARAEATNPLLYGGADVLSSLPGVLIAIFSRKIKKQSTLQAGLTGGLFVVGLYGYFIFQGATWYGSMAVGAAQIVLISVMLGALSENA